MSWDYDEEELKRKSATYLYNILHNVAGDTDEDKKKKALITRVLLEKYNETSGLELSDIDTYELLAYTKFMQESSDQEVKDTYNNAKKRLENAAKTKYQNISKEDNLSNYLQQRALLEVSSITTGDTVYDNQASFTEVNIADKMKDIKESDITPELVSEYSDADDVGVLDNIDNDVKKQFIEKVASALGWKAINKEHLEGNDRHLEANIKDLQVRDDNGKINPLYQACIDKLADDKITFDVPDSEEGKAFAQSLQDQFIYNAAQRATMDLLRNPVLLKDAPDKTSVEAKFSELVAKHYYHSVVLAALVSTEKFTDKIKINKDNFSVAYDEISDTDIENVLNDLAAGTVKIDPRAVIMDSKQLQMETKATKKVIKDFCKVDPNKLSFLTKTINFASNLLKNIAKNGKKIGFNLITNLATYGGAMALIGKGAAILVAGGSALPAAGLLASGYALYAGWSYVSAKVMPVADRLYTEAKQNNISGFSNIIKYMKENWKQAKAKSQEGKLKERSNFRVGEGFVGGLAATAGAFAGNPFIRMGVSAAGKTTQLGKSLIDKFKSKKKREQEYSLAADKELETAKNFVTQDAISLTVVLGMSAWAGHRHSNSDNALGNDGETIGENHQGSGDKKGLWERLNSGKKGQEESLAKANGDTLTITPIQKDSLQAKDTINKEDLLSPKDSLSKEVTDTTSTSVLGGKNPADSAIDPTLGGDELKKGFDTSSLVGDEKDMFENSASKWDNNALKREIIRLQKEGQTISSEVMELYKNHAFGQRFVQGWYDLIQNGQQVETIPEGMSPVVFVDKLTRLMQLAPVEHKQSIDIMLKDLLCQDFHPTESDKTLIESSLNTIIYEKGTIPCWIPDGKGGYCEGSMEKFGQYIGKEQMHTGMYNGEELTLPVRNYNQTTGLNATPNCAENTVNIAATVEKGHLPDCGCDDIARASMVEEPTVYTAENSIIEDAVEVVKNKVSLDFSDASATHAFMEGGSARYPEVDPQTVNGEAIMFDAKTGIIKVNDTDGVNLLDGTSIEGGEIQIPVVFSKEDVSGILNKLSEQPTAVTTTDGVTTITYGTTAQDMVVTINNNSLSVSVGDTEIHMDNEAANLVIDRLNQIEGAPNFEIPAESQVEFDNVDTSKIIEKINDYKKSVLDSLGEQEAEAENVNLPYEATTTVSYTKGDIAEALNNPDNTSLTCIGEKDGVATMQIKIGDSLVQFTHQSPISVSISEDSATANLGGADQDVWAINMKTSDNKTLTVVLDTTSNNIPMTLLDGNKVTLDENTSVTVQSMAETTLKSQGVNASIDLHTPQTEKILGSIAQYRTNVDRKSVV